MITYMGKQKFNVDRFLNIRLIYIDKYTHRVKDGGSHYCGTLQRGWVIRDVTARCPSVWQLYTKGIRAWSTPFIDRKTVMCNNQLTVMYGHL